MLERAGKVRPEIDPKSIVWKKYHDFLDVFSKENLDIWLWMKFTTHLDSSKGFDMGW